MKPQISSLWKQYALAALLLLSLGSHALVWAQAEATLTPVAEGQFRQFRYYLEARNYDLAARYCDRAQQAGEPALLAKIYQAYIVHYRSLGNEQQARFYEQKRAALVPANPSRPAASTPKDETGPVITILSPAIEKVRGLMVVQTKQPQLTLVGRADDPAGISRVYVMGQTVPTDEKGFFSVPLTLKQGNEQIEIVALDHWQNATRLTVSLQRSDLPGAVPPSPVAAAAPAAPGKYFALVIGINDYTAPGVPALKTAVNDAEAIARTLGQQYGFQVKTLVNATRAQIMGALNEYRRNLDADTNLLIYYAGHGVFDEEIKLGYWCPVDARLEENTNWISAEDIAAATRGIKSNHILIISDSCYSGTLTRSWGNANLTAERSQLLQKMLAKSSRTVMASGGNEPVADEYSQGHSVFAFMLLKGLQEVDKDIFTTYELFHDYVWEQVAGRVSQTPQYSWLSNSGHEGGDFVFVRTKK